MHYPNLKFAAISVVKNSAIPACRYLIADIRLRGQM